MSKLETKEINGNDWSESDYIDEIYDAGHNFDYLTTKMIDEAIVNCNNLGDFIWSLERQFDKVEDELSAFKRLIQKIRKESS